VRLFLVGGLSVAVRWLNSGLASVLQVSAAAVPSCNHYPVFPGGNTGLGETFSSKSRVINYSSVNIDTSRHFFTVRDRYEKKNGGRCDEKE
jgi:hypothetical protein